MSKNQMRKPQSLSIVIHQAGLQMGKKGYISKLKDNAVSIHGHGSVLAGKKIVTTYLLSEASLPLSLSLSAASEASLIAIRKNKRKGEDLSAKGKT